MPVVHRLRAGDRVALPLKAGQTLVVTAYPSLMAPSAEAIDMWQALADGDLLELHVTDDPGPRPERRRRRAEEDPLPHLNRDGSAPNGHLIGRERLVAGTGSAAQLRRRPVGRAAAARFREVLALDIPRT
jgi:hypothetical protein